jgi:hypothetical protein
VKNVGAATLDAARAGLSCAPQVDLKADGPFDLRIACARAVRGASCASSVKLKLPRLRGDRIVSAKATRKGKALGRARGRDVRSLKVARATRQAFAVKVTMRTAGGRRVTSTRRIAAC